MFSLLPSNFCLFFKTQFWNHFFQEIFPDPPSHLPPFLPDYFPCPFAVLSVPGTSLCFSTCYTVMLYCHCLSFPHLCPLRVWSSWGQKANLLPVVLARALDLVGAQWIPAEWMGFFPSISEDVDVEDNRCFFYLISNPPISQIFIPLHMTILLWMCIVGAFFEYSQCRRERRKRRNLYWVVTLHTFSINIKNHLRNNLCCKYYYLYYTETESQKDKETGEQDSWWQRWDSSDSI